MGIPTNNFWPNQSYVIAGTGTSIVQAITQPTIPGGQPYTDLRVVNAASVPALIAWGTTSAGTIATTSASVAVAAGATSIFSTGGTGYNFVATILATSTTGNVYISVGNGS